MTKTTTICCLVGVFLSSRSVYGFSSRPSIIQEPTIRLPSWLSSVRVPGPPSGGGGGCVLSRDTFVTTALVGMMTTTTTTTTTACVPILFLAPSVAEARGRATLEQAYDRYAPRIKTGGDFYQHDLKGLVAKADWRGILNALQEPPERTKSDLQKADAGVAERARQAGGFSDARVLVAADLFAASFSENSISSKTKKMQAAILKVRTVVKELQDVANQAIAGAEGKSSIGLFGLGAKKVDMAALAQQAKILYVQGGNAWNEYIAAANESLALKFDRFNYIS